MMYYVLCHACKKSCGNGLAGGKEPQPIGKAEARIDWGKRDIEYQ